MKPGRALSLLTGVALLGVIAKFNEMTPDAQAAFLNDAAATARSWASGVIVTYDQMTGTAAAQQPRTTAAAPPPFPPPHAGEGREGAPSSAAGQDGESPRRGAARPAEPDPPLQGNPLWALPLKQLSMTRDRPIFSPSRRPPPPPPTAFVAPVAVRTPAKPPEPERPTVSLLGTIIGAGTDDQIGVFLDTGTQTVVRLRVGDDHHGWVLRLIKAREATLVKSDDEAVVLQMAAPGDAPLPGLPGVPGGLPGVPSVGLPAVPPSGVDPRLNRAGPGVAPPGTQRARRQR